MLPGNERLTAGLCPDHPHPLTFTVLVHRDLHEAREEDLHAAQPVLQVVDVVL